MPQPPAFDCDKSAEYLFHGLDGIAEANMWFYKPSAVDFQTTQLKNLIFLMTLLSWQYIQKHCDSNLVKFDQSKNELTTTTIGNFFIDIVNREHKFSFPHIGSDDAYKVDPNLPHIYNPQPK